MGSAGEVASSQGGMFSLRQEVKRRPREKAEERASFLKVRGRVREREERDSISRIYPE